MLPLPTPQTKKPNSNASVLAALSDKDNAIVTINATGVIQMANKAAQKLLGVWGA